MLKVSYIITLLSGIGIFNSCTGNFINLQKYHDQLAFMEHKDSVYGNYLAGRVALIRQDYENASKYYIKTMDKGYISDDVLGKTYMILASQGKIEEAAKYANIAREKGDKNSFIEVINAVSAYKNKNYKFIIGLIIGIVLLLIIIVLGQQTKSTRLIVVLMMVGLFGRLNY